jgi:sulfonate transport system permease protein
MSIDLVVMRAERGAHAALELVVGSDRPAGRQSLRRAWQGMWRSNWVRILGPLALLAAWEIAVTWLGASRLTLSSPADVARTAWSMLQDGTLTTALGISLRRVVVGLAIGVPVGALLALASGLFPVGERIIDPVVQMLRTMPALALVPLFILWFGIGEQPKVLLVASAVSFPVYLNLYSGIRGVDDRLVEAGRVFGLGRWRLIRDVILPGALPSFLVGLRFSLGIAWIVLVASEQINATSGLGYMMLNAQNLLQTDVIFVGLLVYSLLGLTSDLLVRLLERWLLSWRHGFQSL